MRKVRNPKFVNTPADLIAKVTNAMKVAEYESMAELERAVPELVGKTEGEQAQILQDSGLELIVDDQPEPPAAPEPVIETPIE